MPSGDARAIMKNPKLLKDQLRATTNHLLDISEARQFERSGLLCKSSNTECVRDLLACTPFPRQPVKAFLPPHPACVQGVVRRGDTSLYTLEVLNMFTLVGVVATFRCCRDVDGMRQLT